MTLLGQGEFAWVIAAIPRAGGVRIDVHSGSVSLATVAISVAIATADRFALVSARRIFGLVATLSFRVALVLAIVVVNLAEQAIAARGLVVEEALLAQIRFRRTWFVLFNIDSSGIGRTRVGVCLSVAPAYFVELIRAHFGLRGTPPIRIVFLAASVISHPTEQPGRASVVIEVTNLSSVSRQFTRVVLGHIHACCKSNTLVVVGEAVAPADGTHNERTRRTVARDWKAASGGVALLAAAVVPYLAEQVLVAVVVVEETPLVAVASPADGKIAVIAGERGSAALFALLVTAVVFGTVSVLALLPALLLRLLRLTRRLRLRRLAVVGVTVLSLEGGGDLILERPSERRGRAGDAAADGHDGAEDDELHVIL